MFIIFFENVLWVQISDENIRIFKHGAGRMLGKGTMSAVAHRLSDMTVSCKFDEVSPR